MQPGIIFQELNTDACVVLEIFVYETELPKNCI